jgi:hypothetical protein
LKNYRYFDGGFFSYGIWETVAAAKKQGGVHHFDKIYTLELDGQGRYKNPLSRW